MKHCSVSHSLGIPKLVAFAVASISPAPANLGQTRIRRLVARFPFALLCLCLMCSFATPDMQAQTNEWTWVGGSNTVGSNGGQPGVYGTLGDPAAGNVPGGRFSPVSWTDASGNFWLFGGQGYDADGNYGNLNDLWKFNPATNEWAWIGGSNIFPSPFPQPGVYGTLGTPAAGNIPGGRYTSVSWTDQSGNLWLFGGGGSDGVYGDDGLLNDLWEFDPSTNQWTWRGGSNAVNLSGVYGTKGAPAAGNVPGSRDNTAASWIDASGDLWLFGGYGYDSTGTLGWLNDLWEFNPSTNQWTWRDGSTTADQSGVYGTLGAPAAGNTPGSRYAVVSWSDANGDFWLFGGNGYAPDTTAAYMNDLWEFNPSSNEWTWMSGSSTYDQFGVYGTLGAPAAGNTPGGRNFQSSWTDSNGNFWLFGGFGDDSSTNQGYLNDLWEFNSSTNEWAWISGSSTLSCSTCNPPGVYGTLGTAAAGNTPGGRYGSVAWTDLSGSLWLFGGFGYDSVGAGGVLNDLWKYTPSPAPPPIAQVTPASLAFGVIPYGGVKILPLTVSNIGGGTLTVATAINGPSYKVLNNCGAGVVAGIPCTLQVEFDPVTVGGHADILTVQTNAAANPTVALSGTAKGISAKTYSPLNFGVIPFGSSAVITLTISNFGVPGPVMLATSINGPSYKILTNPSNTCTAGINQGGTCNLPVEFDPIAVGAHNDVLTVTPSAGGPAFKVHLEGTASGFTVVSSPLQFGTIPFGTTETLTLTINDVAVPGTVFLGTAITGPSYQVLNNANNTCTVGIQAGGTCNLPIEFDPVAVGMHDDVLTLTPNAGAEPFNVELEGTAN
jgi:N-acetylneuraminic acid mutarotase